MEMTHLTEDDIHYYMAVARETSKRSKARRLKVGAVIVSEDRIMAIGYNGTPAGYDNNCEYHTDDGRMITKPEVIHGEINALYKFLNGGISSKGSSMFITHAPCLECSKSLFLANVSQVFYDNEYRSTDGIVFLENHGVKVIKINSHSCRSRDDYNEGIHT